MSEQKLRVLLLDDEKSLREPLASHLREHYGYLVDAVADGIEALRLLEKAEGHHDVALIDEVLEEGLSGLEVLKQIKSRYPKIEVILFTGWGMQAGIEALNAGAYRYFAKPVNVDELALTIRFASEHGRIRQERYYLEALVKVSQGLTRTTRREEQLTLVWDFVRQQLDISTFFLGLYHLNSDKVSFPIVYEDNQRISLPTRLLGNNQMNWGFTGYVIKTGEELCLLTREELEQRCQSIGISPLLEGKATESCLFLPLQHEGRMLGVLSIQSYQSNAFNDTLLDAVRALSHQVSVALENSRLFIEWEQKVREAKQQARNLRTLQNLALTVSSSLDIREIVTKSCQAVVELSGSDHSGLVLFDEQLIEGRVEAEYPDIGAVGLRIPLQGVAKEQELVKNRKPVIVTDVATEESFGPVRDILLNLGIQSIVIVPVISKGRFVGSFSLDAVHRSQKWTQEQVELCEAFAMQVAVAIENAQLFQSLQEASTAVLFADDPYQLAQNIVERACRLTGADGSAFLSVDETPYSRVLASEGIGRDLALIALPRPNGNSKEVARSGKALFVSDLQSDPNNIHPELLKYGVRAVACLPLPLLEKTIGVLWLDFLQAHSFSDTERTALQLYAKQSAIAYNNTRRLWELKHLHDAAEGMAKAQDTREVLQQIVDCAQDVLEAEYAFIWSYDHSRDVFIPEELTASRNTPSAWFEKFCKEPEIGQTTRRVLHDGYLTTTDISNADSLGKNTRDSLNFLQVQSFQGIRLEVGSEPLGVLYVDYKTTRGFGTEQRRLLEHFASDAALTLARARLGSQVNRSRRAARAVAKVSTLGKLEDTLVAIVEGAQDALRCEIATLYTYDEETRHFVLARGRGYKSPNSMRPPAEIHPSSALWKIINLKEKDHHVSEDALNDDLLKGRFVDREGVKSAIGIQLRFREHRVGVMFINYCKSHRFTEDEIEDALQFGNQAAVAIRNAQLFEETESARKRAELVASISQKISSNLEVVDLLDALYGELHGLLPNDILPSTVLWDPNHSCLRLVKSKIYDYKSLILETEKQRECIQLGEGLTGWAASYKEPVYLRENLDGDLRFKRFAATTRSEMAVPIVYGQERELIGVLDIESPIENAFSEEEFSLIQTLSNQLAVAIRNAELHGKTKQQAEALLGLYEAGKAITSALTLEETLGRIAKQALQIVRANPQDGSFSHVALCELDKLRFHAASSSEILRALQQRMDIDLKRAGKVGIVGRVVEKGVPENVSDVRRDPDYIGLIESTRSQLAVPLIIGDRIIGVLSVEHPVENAFSDKDVRHLELLAAQAVVAIENVRLFEAAEQWAANLDAVFRVSETLISSLDLGHILTAACQAVVHLLKVDHSGLVLFDQDLNTGKVITEYPEIGAAGVVIPLYGVPVEEQLIASKEPLVVSDVASIPGFDPVREMLIELGIRSILIVPIISKGRPLGSFSVDIMNHQHAFKEEEIELCKLFAAQVAIAIENARSYQEAITLQRVTASLAGTLEWEEVLNQVMAEAMTLTGTQSGGFLFWDANKEDFVLSFATTGPDHKLQQYETRARARGGIARTIIEERQPLINENSLTDPRVSSVAIEKERLAFVGVPLIVANEPIGVLFVNSSRPRKFPTHQVELLKTFAAHAAIAVERARRFDELKRTYEELKLTKGLVGARSALAWMGMASSAWRHSIDGDAITISSTIKLLRQELKRTTSNKDAPIEVEEKLDRIERLAKRILEKPITPPLSSEEGVTSVSVNDLIRERMKQLWVNEPYRAVELRLDLTLEESNTVGASPEWLRRALDILVDNAVEAMVGRVHNPLLTITTSSSKNGVLITINDVGSGIPQDILPKLFRERILGTNGLGMGLLMAQAIFQTYGGEICWDSSADKGTTFVVWLPLEQWAK